MTDASDTPGTTGQSPAREVRHNEEGRRYEILVDGTLAGFAEYRDRPGQRVFHHTEVGDAYQGQGLAGQLVGEALSQVRGAGLRAVPVCPYVAAYVRRHAEDEGYADVVDPVTPDVLAWLG